MTHPDAPVARPRLPDVALPPLAGGDPVPVRMRRTGTVLVLLDASPAPRDVAYVRALADAHDELAGWDGRAFAVVADGAARLPELALPVLHDARGIVARAAGVTVPALVVADQWGEIHAAHAVGADDAWLHPREVADWLRFITIRCAG